MSNNRPLKFLIALIIIIGLTLPFHWVFSEPIVVPKKSLSFDRTFVTENDVQEIVEKYYLGSPKEKFEVENDPLTDALIKRWSVRETEDAILFQHLK